jgi:hypothetical protein
MHKQGDNRSFHSDKYESEARIQERSLGWDVPIDEGSNPSSYHSGVHHSEWSSQEPAQSSSPTDEVDSCLLRGTSDRNDRQYADL